MKTKVYLMLCVFLSLSICQVGLSIGGKGNVKQLGKQLYVWHFDEGKGDKAEDETAGLVGEF